LQQLYNLGSVVPSLKKTGFEIYPLLVLGWILTEMLCCLAPKPMFIPIYQGQRCQTLSAAKDQKGKINIWHKI
jgi:hypothetical protein